MTPHLQPFPQPRREIVRRLRLLPFLALAAAALLAPPASAQTPAPAPSPEATGPAYDEAPVLLDRDSVLASLHRLYPEELRKEGMGGVTTVRFTVRTDGTTAGARVEVPARHPAVDSAALAVVGGMRFTPAKLRGSDVEATVSLPIAFQAPEGPATSPAESADFEGAGVAPGDSMAVATLEKRSAEMVDMGEVERPEVVNLDALRRAIVAGYPASLRAAGIGGTAQVRMRVTRDGEPEGIELLRSTGNGALDRFALRVAGQARFAPARIGARVLPIWVVLPIELSPPPPDPAFPPRDQPRY